MNRLLVIIIVFLLQVPLFARSSLRWNTSSHVLMTRNAVNKLSNKLSSRLGFPISAPFFMGTPHMNY